MVSPVVWFRDDPSIRGGRDASNGCDASDRRAGLMRRLDGSAAAGRRCWLAVLLLHTPVGAAAQVQIRLGVPGRATYSELHEGLKAGTPEGDSVRAILGGTAPAPLWRRLRAALDGTGAWNHGLIALTRLAELRSAAYADSAERLTVKIEAGEVTAPPGIDPADLLEPLRAIALERAREERGDASVRADILARVPSGGYGLADAWVLGRLGDGTADTLTMRLLAAPDAEQRVRYLTLLSFSRDTTAIPFLARVYAAPDSFDVPARYATRASDGLLWIGTRASLSALKEAREVARARGVYADPSLSRGGYDFLANDSSAAVSRTGRRLDEWLAELSMR